MPDFELYLQFDCLRQRTLMTLRGADLRAFVSADRAAKSTGISTTLVVTAEEGQ